MAVILKRKTTLLRTQPLLPPKMCTSRRALGARLYHSHANSQTGDGRVGGRGAWREVSSGGKKARPHHPSQGAFIATPEIHTHQY